jgi:multidrug efflux pump subunit AcrB
VDDAVAPRLRRVDGVAGMIISGGDAREVHLLTRLDALAARGLAIADVLTTLPRQVVNNRGGPLWLGKREYTLRTLARPETLDDLGDIVLRRDAGGIVHLADVAEARIEPAVGQTMMRMNGVPGISLGIQRQTGANVPTTASGVQDALAELRRTFAISGVPIDFTVLYSETTYIDDAVKGALKDSLIGVALGAIALLIALRSPKAVLLVAAVQPLAVLCVFPVLWFLGRSLNIITLAGLAFGIGITIDNAIVVGFNVRPDTKARERAQREGVDVRFYNVIYSALEEIEQSLKGMLKPEFEEIQSGVAEIREIFRSSKLGNIAGCIVRSGTITRNSKARVIREGVVIADGLAIESLRRFKDDVTEVKTDFECGIGLGKFNDLQLGDEIETIEMKEKIRA